MEIGLAVYQPIGSLTDVERDVMRRALFGCVDGVDDASKRSWRRFWGRLSKAELGECVFIKTNNPRSGPFHRRHMAIEQAVFNAQERFTDFQQFRVWLKVGAGHVDWVAGPKGAVIPIPKSISYSKLDEDGMREFHEKTVAFLRDPHALKVLWPKASAQKREEGLNAILDDFER